MQRRSKQPHRLTTAPHAGTEGVYMMHLSQIARERKSNKEQVFHALGVILLLLTVIGVFLALFYRLDASGLTDTDEEWHATNAWEMFQSGNWTINTHFGSVDYFNSKPPLNLRAILLSFHLLGVSFFSFKLPSVLAACVTFFLILVVLLKRQGLMGVLSFACAFLLLDRCYQYHMFRSGNMDSMFCMWIALAVWALWRAETDFRWICLYAFFTGLCFMTKGTHVMIPLLIGLLDIPHLRKNWSFRPVIPACVLAIVPSLTWAIHRYSFDGTALFEALLFGETSQKVTGKPTAEYFAELAHQPVVRILLLTLLLCILAKAAALRNPGKFLRSVRQSISQSWLLWLSFFIPLIVYSLAGSYFEWYIYPSHIAAAALTGYYCAVLGRILHGTRAEALCIVYLGILLLTAFLSCKSLLSSYRAYGTGTAQIDLFNQSLAEAGEQLGQAVYGKHAYVEEVLDADGISPRESWHGDEKIYAEYRYKMQCIDRGAEGFQTDPGAILIVSISRLPDVTETLREAQTSYTVLSQDASYAVLLRE